ncbi:STAS domain-containing protein [Compostibacter hankyongensis]
MKFKIDTKEKYLLLTPETARLDAKLAEEIQQALARKTAGKPASLIIDLNEVEQADEGAFQAILAVYRGCYAEQGSCVLARPRPALLSLIRQHYPKDDLNVAPSLPEAVDLILMEELERELNNEQEEKSL